MFQSADFHSKKHFFLLIFNLAYAFRKQNYRSCVILVKLNISHTYLYVNYSNINDCTWQCKTFHLTWLGENFVAMAVRKKHLLNLKWLGLSSEFLNTAYRNSYEIIFITIFPSRTAFRFKNIYGKFSRGYKQVFRMRSYNLYKKGCAINIKNESLCNIKLFL